MTDPRLEVLLSVLNPRCPYWTYEFRSFGSCSKMPTNQETPPLTQCEASIKDCELKEWKP